MAPRITHTATSTVYISRGAVISLSESRLESVTRSGGKIQNRLPAFELAFELLANGCELPVLACTLRKHKWAAGTSEPQAPWTAKAGK